MSDTEKTGSDRRQYQRIDTIGGWQCCNYPAADLCFESSINISEGGASILVPEIREQTPTVGDMVDMDFILMGKEFLIASIIVRISQEVNNGKAFTRAHIKFNEMSERQKESLKRTLVEMQILSDIEMTVTGIIYNKSKSKYPFKIVAKNILLKGD